MGYLAVRSFQTRVDLVSEDYYRQELQYQEQIEKVDNASRLARDITVEQQPGKLIVQFPNSDHAPIHGTLHLFRPSDARFDRSSELSLNGAGQHHLTVDHLPRGFYRVKVDWATDTEAYYSEQSVYLR